MLNPTVAISTPYNEVCTGVSLRVSLTERCQLRCTYCRPASVIEAPRPPAWITVADVARFVEILQKRFGLAKIRFTGGEPLLSRDLPAFVAAVRDLGIPEIALTTNGQLLARRIEELKDAGLGRLNVSLDSLKPDVFSRVTGGGALERTLAGIDAALANGFRPLRLNTVVLRGVNDVELEDLVRYAFARGCEARFIELMPAGISTSDYATWFMSTDEIFTRLSRTFTLSRMNTEPGASARRWAARDLVGCSGVIGFISPSSHPFCGECRRLRLTAVGELVPCLGRPDRLDVRAWLRSGTAAAEMSIVNGVHWALGCKRPGDTLVVPRSMCAIGG